jgi:hypothetical protein
MIFALCSVVAAAGFAFAFEGGRVCERRLLGHTAPPYKKVPGGSTTVMTTMFLLIVAAEYFLLPRLLNPLSPLLDPQWYSNASPSPAPLSTSALVFASWSGLLALGYGLFVAWGRALHNERKMYEMDKADFGRNMLAKEKKLQEERLLVKKERAELVNARTVVVQQQEQLQVQAQLLEEEADKMMLHVVGQDMTALPEGERVWSRKLFHRLDVKAFSIAKAALDKRWSELEEWESNVEMLKQRKKEREEKLAQMRERRQERVKVNKDELEDERDNLRRLTAELEALKIDMSEFKEESKMREEEKINELNDRIQLLDRREADLIKREDKAFRQRQARANKSDSESSNFDSPNTQIVDPTTESGSDVRHLAQTEDDQQVEGEYGDVVSNEGLYERLSTIEEAVEDEGSSSSRGLSSSEDEQEVPKVEIDMADHEECSLSETNKERNYTMSTDPESGELSPHEHIATVTLAGQDSECDESQSHETTALPETPSAITREESRVQDIDVTTAAADQDSGEVHHDAEQSPVGATEAANEGDVAVNSVDRVNKHEAVSGCTEAVSAHDENFEATDESDGCATSISDNDCELIAPEGVACEESRLHSEMDVDTIRRGTLAHDAAESSAADAVAAIDGGDHDKNEAEDNATTKVNDNESRAHRDEVETEEEDSLRTDTDDDDDEYDEYEMAYCDETSITNTSIVMDDVENGVGVEIVVGNSRDAAQQQQQHY